MFGLNDIFMKLFNYEHAMMKKQNLKQTGIFLVHYDFFSKVYLAEQTDGHEVTY